jgi:hypothetical protein
MVFLSSSCRETAKNAIKRIEEKNYRKKGFSLVFVEKSV